jgi:hypothetical protein
MYPAFVCPILLTAHKQKMFVNFFWFIKEIELLMFQNFLSSYSWLIVEPRAGFAPAACCLRGSRSTGLSHRGTCTG